MRTLLAWTYALIAYALGVAALVAFIGFVTGFLMPWTVDGGAVIHPMAAITIDLALIALFGVQHSVMARKGFKARWSRIVPGAYERSTFLVASGVALALLIGLWQPLPAALWHVTDPVGWWVLTGIALGGWGLVFLTTFMIDHFELFGFRQVYSHVSGRPCPVPQFRTPALYRRVRHPMQLGILIGLWVTPSMTVGHLLLAAGMTVYVLIGLLHEERDLVASFGARYRAYQATTPKLIPFIGRRAKRAAVAREA